MAAGAGEGVEWLRAVCDIPPATVDIPGRTSDHVDFLQFWASVVPHVGINEPTGSFLASFEALAALPGAGGREP